MLPALAREIGAWIGSFSTTTNIAADTNVVSTALRDTGFIDDDTLNDTFVRILGTTNSEVVRRVNDYTGSSGTLVVTGTNLAAESASRTFELYRYDPGQFTDAINDAREKAFPRLYNEINDRTHTTAFFQRRFARPTSIRQGHVRQIYLEPRINAKTFAGNIAATRDVDFEGALTDWSTSNITLTAETETTDPDNFMVFAGQQSGKCVVAATSAGTMYLSDPSPTAYDGEEINVGIWVYSKTASRITAAVRVDSGTAATGTAHSGGGWERLAVGASIGDVSSTLQYGLTVTSGTAFVFYADETIVTAGPAEMPQLTGRPVTVWRAEGDEIVIGEAVANDRNLHIRGHGLLSSVSSGSDTLEIDGVQARLLYNIAAQTFLQGDIDQISDSDMNAAQRRWRHFFNREQEGVGTMMPLALRRTPVSV